MADYARFEGPLVAGPTAALEALFADWTSVHVEESNGRHYPAPAGYYLFSGLPGSLGKGCALFVRPPEHVRLAAERCLANGVIAAFRCVRSARYLQDDLLPVYVTDPQHVAGRLRALLSYGEHYMVPGQWLSPAQAYAMLTLNNMVEKIAPNVLGPFLNPMRGLLKRMLCDAHFDLYGLDRKIEIDMPAMPDIGDLDFSNLVEALIHEQPARFVIRTSAGLEHTVSDMPLTLRITASGWSIELRQTSAPEPVTISVADIRQLLVATESDE